MKISNKLCPRNKTNHIMLAIEEKRTSKVAQGTYNLIKGEYSPYEALEIINSLFSQKINFHEVKSFSELIRYGTKDEDTTHRLNELRLNQQYATEFIKEAKETGKHLRIRSTITIEYV